MVRQTGTDARTDMERCIDECTICQAVCLSAVQYCLHQVGQRVNAEVVRLLLDCAEICRTSADFRLRGSELHVLTCATCAEICSRGADACESMGDDEELMEQCADACRQCARACRQMAATA